MAAKGLSIPVCLAMAATMLSAQSLPVEPFHDRGQGVTPAYEGWFQNADGSYSLSFGYFSRNQVEELDVPAGPNNRIEPGGPDQGQPTHFIPGRMWGIFVVNVPKDFGKNQLTWTLTVNGQTARVPAGLDPLWEISPYKEATGNTPPVLKFESGAMNQGPEPITVNMAVTEGAALNLPLTIADDAKLPSANARMRPIPVAVTWSKYRGPGKVTFGSLKPAIEKTAGDAAFNGKASTTATFSEPGDYILRVVGNDLSGSGGGGYQCCWTNAFVKVTVK
jgi:hypothetical protein